MALFDVYEAAVYAQDEWQVTPKLFVTYGFRYDVSRFPTTPAPNPLLASGVARASGTTSSRRTRTSRRGSASPMTRTPTAGRSSAAALGCSTARAPYVLYGNTLSNTGLTQLDLNCVGAAATPQPDLASYAQNPSTIPTTCVGGGAAAASKASPVVFAPDFQQTQAWKSNLAYDRLIAPNWRLTIEGVFTRTTNDYVVQDVESQPGDAIHDRRRHPGVPDGGDDSDDRHQRGRPNINNTRRDVNFNNVFVQSSKGEAKSAQGIIQVNGVMAWGSVLASYTYDRTRDYNSSSCCIAGGDLFNSGRTVGDPNDFRGQYAQAGYARTHRSSSHRRSRCRTASSSVASIAASPVCRGRRSTAATSTGDGVTNDRLYVPTDAEVAAPNFITFFHNPAQGLDSATQRSQFAAALQNNACLSEHRGTVISRNSCQNPWQNILDARVAKRFDTARGQALEVSVDFFNLLNGLSSKWGQRNEVQAANDQRTHLARLRCRRASVTSTSTTRTSPR